MVPREGRVHGRSRPALRLHARLALAVRHAHARCCCTGPPFIKPPGVWNERVSQQDVVPTLAALLGTAPPAHRNRRPCAKRWRPRRRGRASSPCLSSTATRADYLDTYREVLPTLTRLRAGGAWYSQAHVSSVPTLTAVGHANLGTGAEPGTPGARRQPPVQPRRPASRRRPTPSSIRARCWRSRWPTSGTSKPTARPSSSARAARSAPSPGSSATAAASSTGGRCGPRATARRVTARGRPTRSATSCRTRLKPFTGPPLLDRGERRRGWATTSPALEVPALGTVRALRGGRARRRARGRAARRRRHPGSRAGQPEGAGLRRPRLRARLARDEGGNDGAQSAAGAGAGRSSRRKAGAGRLVVAIAADHGMPGEPPPGGRHYLDDIGKRIDARFSPAAAPWSSTSATPPTTRSTSIRRSSRP